MDLKGNFQARVVRASLLAKVLEVAGLEVLDLLLCGVDGGLEGGEGVLAVLF
jgi:hypothetical protein